MDFNNKLLTLSTHTIVKFLQYLLLIVCIVQSDSRAFDIDHCNKPLGMETGSIADFQITSSSAHDMSFVGPQHSRLKIDNSGGAWCPKGMVSRGLQEYLQIDLLQVHVVTGILTQGRYGNGQGQEYTEAFVLDYWRPGFEKWKRWKNSQEKEILTANTNTYSSVENLLQPVMYASKIRIFPYSQYDRTVCLRAEIIGCNRNDGLLSYNIPKGVQRGFDFDLSDRTYDGDDDSDHLVGGLGQLVDGQRGTDNFRMDKHGFGKGFEWVGWRNDTLEMADGKPVKIIFEFDGVRNFTSIAFHTNNMLSKNVQVFGSAKAYFSFDGEHFNGEPVHFAYMPDVTTEHARDVTIKLHNRIGRYLSVHLYFVQRWIMISEVSFISEPVTGNYTEEKITGTFPYDPIEMQRDDVHQRTTNRPQVIIPRRIDQNPENNYIGAIIAVLATVTLLLIAALLFIVARNKRVRQSQGMDSFQHNFMRDGTNMLHDKQLHHNGIGLKIPSDDSGCNDQDGIYHEPFKVNMTYASSSSGCSSNDCHHHPPHPHLAPEYTDIACPDYAVPHMQDNRSYTYQAPTLPLHFSFPEAPPGPPPPINANYMRGHDRRAPSKTNTYYHQRVT